jgi:hypothetical protein
MFRSVGVYSNRSGRTDVGRQGDKNQRSQGSERSFPKGSSGYIGVRPDHLSGAGVAGARNTVPSPDCSAKAGLGVVPLPTALDDAEPCLIRVVKPVAERRRILRLPTTLQWQRRLRVVALFRLHRPRDRQAWADHHGFTDQT